MKKSKLNELNAGDRFSFCGFEWIVLDPDMDGGVLSIMSSPWKKCCFDKNSNNYRDSSLRRELKELLPVLCDDLIPHEINLVTKTGDDRYGKIEDKIFILSCYEYCKYCKNIPLSLEYMWTCTPWYISTNRDGSLAICISDLGSFHPHVIDEDLGVFPACVFKKNLQI